MSAVSAPSLLLARARLASSPARTELARPKLLRDVKVLQGEAPLLPVLEQPVGVPARRALLRVAGRLGLHAVPRVRDDVRVDGPQREERHVVARHQRWHTGMGEDVVGRALLRSREKAAVAGPFTERQPESRSRSMHARAFVLQASAHTHHHRAHPAHTGRRGRMMSAASAVLRLMSPQKLNKGERRSQGAPPVPLPLPRPPRSRVHRA